MEREYKWRASAQDLSLALLWASNRIGSETRKIEMDATYFDTASSLIQAHGGALRLRRENNNQVCCMKIRSSMPENGLHAHEEYECAASSIDAGLLHLPQAGAPQALCDEVLALGVQEICRITFTRISTLIVQGNTVCELCLDSGTLARGEMSAPLSEIEMEFITGNETDFHTLASNLCDYLSLQPEPLSKVARAMQLSN